VLYVFCQVSRKRHNQYLLAAATGAAKILAAQSARGGLSVPTYEYKHLSQACSLGIVFETVQPIAEPPLTACPNCGSPVKRLISRVSVVSGRSNAELRDMGFTKLVRRDSGVYENVTRRGSESRYFEADKPETAPDLKRIITD